MIALQLENINKKFLLTKALDNFSVDLEKGKLIGLLGPNGSGKSTLMKIIAGLLHPTSGSIKFPGNSVKDNETLPKGYTLKEKVSFMPTESHLYEWMTIEEIVDFYTTFFKDFDKVQSHSFITDMELKLDQKIKTLSTGQTGRLKVALTLARNTDICLLDEPLNGIDPISRDMILELMASQVTDDRCIIISSHLVHEFETITDEAVFLNKGKLELKGNVDKLRTEYNKSLHDIYKEVYKNA